MKLCSIGGKVTANFFAHVDRFALRLASDRDLSLKDAVKQMEKEATVYATEAVATQLGAPPEEVVAIWESEERSRASVRTTSYGAGTFSLGEKAVFDGLQKQMDDKEGKEGEGGPKARAETTEDRIKQLLEERRKAAEKRKKDAQRKKKDKQQFRIQDVPPNKDEWWAAETVPNKKQFLMAYWAERDPHVKVIKRYPRSCVRCGGDGVLKYIASRGEPGENACPRCKSLRIDRVIRFH